MCKKSIVIWIDVSKLKLNCYCAETDEWEEIKNSEEAIEKYIDKVGKIEGKKNLIILYESTGVYSSKLLKVCNTKKVKHHQIHPTQFSQVCSWMWKKNKNDILDAKSIANIWYLMLENMWNLTLPSTNVVKTLMSYLSNIDSLKKIQRRYRNLKDKVKNDVFDESDIIEFYNKNIDDIDKKIEEYLEKVKKKLQENWYGDKLRNLQTIPWIWEQVWIYLILFFIDLADKWIGKEEKRKVTSYSGLNPVEEQSWTSLKRSKISKRWRSVVRDILYMPSMNWYKFTSEKSSKREKYLNTTMWKFFIRMKDKFESPNNKRWNSVIVAMMKKTLITAWWIFRNDTQYNRS